MNGAMPRDLDLTLVSRKPCRLADATLAWTERLRSRDLHWPVNPSSKPNFSIVIVTYNRLEFTKLCLSSIALTTGTGGYEVIVVDNGSIDGTREFLRELSAPVSAIFNDDNRGFAHANNQGLIAARGEILVLLNNDTIVTPGWLDRLAAHTSGGGLVGPVTNRIGNEAEIETDYRALGQMLDFANQLGHAKQGQTTGIATLCMFCLVMRRDVLSRLGPIDERYEVGMLEDDDYSARARQAGLRLACAEDVFIHHFGQASFGELVATGEYQELLACNRERYIKKWGEPPPAYHRRTGPVYQRLVRAMREVVETRTPTGATVAVVSRGDDAIVQFRDRAGLHFPQNDIGDYAGFHPADDIDAIARLKAIANRGAGYLLFPSTAFWWFDHYAGLSAHLGEPLYRDDACAIYALESELT